MATKKSQNSTKIKINNRQAPQSHTRQLVLGLLLVLLVVGSYAIFKYTKNQGVVLPPAFNNEQTPSVTPSEDDSLDQNTGAENQVKTLPITAGGSISYTVKGNETLEKIGITFCDAPDAWMYLAEINSLEPPFKVSTGQIITVSCE